MKNDGTPGTSKQVNLWLRLQFEQTLDKGNLKMNVSISDPCPTCARCRTYWGLAPSRTWPKLKRFVNILDYKLQFAMAALRTVFQNCAHSTGNLFKSNEKKYTEWFWNFHFKDYHNYHAHQLTFALIVCKCKGKGRDLVNIHLLSC